VIPAIDLLAGRAVFLTGGERGTEEVVADDPVVLAREWQRRGARRLHVVDLDAAIGSGENRDVVRRILRALEPYDQVGSRVRAAVQQNRPGEGDGWRSQLDCGLLLRLDSNGKVLEYLSVIGFYGLPLTWLDDYIGQVNKVTVAQIKDAFARRIKPDNMVTVIVGGNGESK